MSERPKARAGPCKRARPGASPMLGYTGRLPGYNPEKNKSKDSALGGPRRNNPRSPTGRSPGPLDLRSGYSDGGTRPCERNRARDQRSLTDGYTPRRYVTVPRSGRAHSFLDFHPQLPVSSAGAVLHPGSTDCSWASTPCNRPRTVTAGRTEAQPRSPCRSPNPGSIERG